jgi:hypothetical protein
MRAHHIFPQAKAFSSFFANAGIDIDEFRVQVSQTTHVDLHTTSAARTGIQGLGPGGLWNTAWRSFAVANPQASQAEIFEFATELLSGNKVPYYSELW